MTLPTEVLILGGTGFIGQRLTDRLCGSEPGGVPQMCRRLVSLSSRDCNLLDLTQSRRQLAQVSTTTTLVVCAGLSRLAGDSWSLFQSNLTMVRNLLQAIKPVQPRGIVFLSSTDVYGLPAAESPITESTLPRPTTYYGLAKLACERMFTLARLGACPVACLRLPGIYGASDGGRSVVGTFCRRLAAGKQIQLSSDGCVFRDFVHVDDLCALIEALVASPAEVTLNVATGSSALIGHIAAEVAAQLRLPDAKMAELFESIPTNSDRDYGLTFDSRRLRELYPNVSFREINAGIKSYIQEMEQIR